MTPMTTAGQTATAVGGLFLAATASYLVGGALIDSAVDVPADLSNLNETQVRLGVFLEFINCAAVVGIGVLLFPILRQYREGMALGYAASRVIEAALLLVSGLFALSVLFVGEQSAGDDAANASQLETLGGLAMEAYDLAFQLALVVLGAGSLLLCYVLYEARLVPRALPVLGLVGYLSLFASAWFEIAGHDASVLYVPGGLFELIFPLWLIVKGLNEPTIAARSAAESMRGTVG